MESLSFPFSPVEDIIEGDDQLKDPGGCKARKAVGQWDPVPDAL